MATVVPSQPLAARPAAEPAPNLGPLAAQLRYYFESDFFFFDAESGAIQGPDELRAVVDTGYAAAMAKSVQSSSGPEFIAEAVRNWLARRGSKTLYIAPGSPWENASSETFNSRLRDELLDRVVFETLTEAKVLIEDHRLDYNHRRPHSSLGYRTPAEFAAAQIKPGAASIPPTDAVMIPDPALS